MLSDGEMPISGYTGWHVREVERTEVVGSHHNSVLELQCENAPSSHNRAPALFRESAPTTTSIPNVASSARCMLLPFFISGSVIWTGMDGVGVTHIHRLAALQSMIQPIHTR